MLSLPELQSRFFASLARQPGVGPLSFDPALVAWVEGRGQLGAEERVDIYAQMYYARLFEILKGDFPRVAAILGCDRFHEVTSAYLAQHPSTHPSLRQLGRFFSAFLQARPESEELPFLSELAALEWARVEVFDAPDTEPLRAEHLQMIQPDDWPALILHLVPAFQVVNSEWPLHVIWKAAEEDEAPHEEAVAREPSVLRVWRNGFSVYHTKMDATEQMVLTGVMAGNPFDAICETLESQLSAEESATAVGSLLLRWIEDGVLAANLLEH